MFLVFILYISGVCGATNSICALKGSSVNLTCSAKHPTANMTWYIQEPKKSEISTDGHRVTSMSEENHCTLTIKDLRDSDANFYCWGRIDDDDGCCQQVIVSDLQVKVIPYTEEQTVTLMCSTSCPLTEKPAAYIWYKNRELVYEDWSPWYQHLVSSEGADTYSCAIKGYEDLRAPEVSVDSVTPSCFTVTYAKGRMCSSQNKPEDKPCNITYPKEIRVETSSDAVTCNTSCPLIDPQKTVYSWFYNRDAITYNKKSQLTVTDPGDLFSCSIKGHEDVVSPEVCPGTNCWSVNYVSRRICALEGSSVNISSKYSHLDNQQPQSKCWSKVTSSGEEDVEQVEADHVEIHENVTQHILTIKNLKKSDSAEYIFKLKSKGQNQFNSHGVTLVVTDVTVKLQPAVVTEGQRVTLTCSTSCPLPVNTNYSWYFNSRPLTLNQSQNKQNKHLVLDLFNSKLEGHYSCAVRTYETFVRSDEKTLSLQRNRELYILAAGVSAALLVIIPLVVFFWIRRKRSSGQSSTTEATENTGQFNPDSVYGNISNQPTQQDQLHYGTVHFSRAKTDHLCSTVSTVPHPQSHNQGDIVYAAVNIRRNVK